MSGVGDPAKRRLNMAVLEVERAAWDKLAPEQQCSRAIIAALRRQPVPTALSASEMSVAFDTAEQVTAAHQAKERERTRNGLQKIQQKRATSKRPSDADLLAKVNELRAAWSGSADDFWQHVADHYAARGWSVTAKYLRDLVSKLRRR